MEQASPSDKPRATLTADYQRDWPAYYDAVDGKPARDTCVRAVKLFNQDHAAKPFKRDLVALDIACGSGRDTLELLRQASPRWRVIATDYHTDGTKRTLHSIGLEDMGRVMICQLTMEETPAKGGEVIPRNLDLVNASFALPFCDPTAFPTVWAFIVDRIRRGGRFSGQFFGDRDEWQPVRPGSHHTRAQVESLLQPFAIEHLEEVEKEGDDAMGGTKRHHVFHVVARKL
ncbi:MAG: class I SAM-dependent methyltransferase [Phycisphaerales bacterium]